VTTSWVQRHPLFVFLGLTFGITWSIGAASVLATDWFTTRFGPLNTRAPLFYLMVWAPNIAAIIVVSGISGWSGIRDLFARLGRWRVQPWVWIVALGFYPALMAVVEIVGLAFGDSLPGPQNLRAFAAGLVYLPLIALGPLGEELGWRGFLLPRMLDQMPPLAAALIVGAIWMVWHLPAFIFMSDLPQSGMSLPIFVVGGLALSVFNTWLFLNARHSILIAGIIPHTIANAWGEAIGPMTWINAGVLTGGAVLLIWLIGLRDVAPATGQTNRKLEARLR
jgi:uncharacterized protein